MSSKKILTLISFLIVFFFNIGKIHSIEPDVFVQSTVNRAAKTLSGNFTKEERIKKLKEIATIPDGERDLSGKNKQTLLRAVVHAADISNPTKPFNIAMKWSERIIKEFFAQGDKERELGFPITMLCDRNTVNFSDS